MNEPLWVDDFEAGKEIEMGKNGLNKVLLIGNLGRDPEQKFLQNPARPLNKSTGADGAPGGFSRESDRDDARLILSRFVRF